ncbi:efflux transporter, outer membrane factor lipoprotein, NodT family [Herbaspirillum sp. CF444]|uniref:efflux transporter outer membrane subunit n=1 Tax=Herbaspirillum sp. CF444 TaxID=1144319 RepID=UPI000272461C|nr:efflux transporter outer membrane subunit [Herbaspirillum sp. CF444]EJL88342.1 efflux transporter, outer membrane factor lipoprotein, NodT family [Herbaspirillum sp. CF444]
MKQRKINRLFLLTPLVAALAACTLGPDYVRPTMPPAPTAFKELQGWKPAQPNELALNGKWWEMFNDAQLNALVEQVDVSNQNLAVAEANFRKAMALVQTARADYYPTVGLSASKTRSATYTAAGKSTTKDSYALSLNAAWEIDVWGRVRRNVESNEASAQATAADLAAARLSAQAQLAQNYLQLRVLDAQQQLLEDTVAAYQRSYQLTQNQYAAGIVAKSDVIQAQTQLKTAQAQALDNGVQRAQLEHAIALLVGQPASSFAIKPSPLTATAPPIPLAMPSMLLERRPDVAGAERRVASANAQIGVSEAAYYPDFSLTGSAGYLSTNGIANLFNVPSRVWSLGPQISQVIFDGGAGKAATNQAIATYDAAAATYKQTVLTAFQEVEDNLAALRILEQEAAVQDEALQSARLAVTLVTNQYKAGTVSYVSVITAQATALASERSALDILYRRMAASVLLTKALGGGWSDQNIADMGKLATQSEQSKKN